MDLQAESLKVDAWKCYTGSPPKGIEQGWWMDDEKIAYPMPSARRPTGLRAQRPAEEFYHPRDLIQAAKDFPDIDRSNQAWPR